MSLKDQVAPITGTSGGIDGAVIEALTAADLDGHVEASRPRPHPAGTGHRHRREGDTSPDLALSA